MKIFQYSMTPVDFVLLILTTLLLLCATTTTRGASPQARWAYSGEKGPYEWSKIEERCGGAKQSPINIYTHQVVLDKTLGDLTLINYNKTPPSGGWRITNDGHTAKIDGVFDDDAMRPAITGAGLPSEYDFLQMHFHWGHDDNPGSEHLLNYKRFPAELHIVHVRRDFALNGSDDWQEESTGLAVLGVLLDIGPRENLFFDNIIQALKTIKYANQKAKLKTLQLRDLLPNRAIMPDEDLAYFRYMGSLTTPDCFESVIWTVLQQHVYISARQYRELQKLNAATHAPAGTAAAAAGDENSIHDQHQRYRAQQHDDEESGIVNNYRPVQPLNGRIVLANRLQRNQQNNLWPSSSSASVAVAAPSLTCMLVVLALILLFKM